MRENKMDEKKIMKEFFNKLKTMGVMQLNKNVTKVKYIMDSFTSTSVPFTTDKNYEVIGMFIKGYSDGSQGVYYLVIDDNSRLFEASPSWFKIVGAVD